MSSIVTETDLIELLTYKFALSLNWKLMENKDVDFNTSPTRN
jgi:hypothetical protein